MNKKQIRERYLDVLREMHEIYLHDQTDAELLEEVKEIAEWCEMSVEELLEEDACICGEHEPKPNTAVKKSADNLFHFPRRKPKA